MKIRDIVNRDIVNLTNCEHEPIHIPGSIQPQGFLIAFTKRDHRIDFCSGNVQAFTGIHYEQLLSKTLEEILSDDQLEKLLGYIDSHTAVFAMPLELELNDTWFSISIHSSGEHCIMEFEASSSTSSDLSVFYNQTRQFVSYMEKSTSLQTLCQAVADETRNITGYDRVMIYRFDKDYNGEIFAESKRDDIEGFLGLHYPHTDIPAQARELYKQNLLRLITDINYEPVPIYTIDDQPDKNLNLGNALLRSVSPIHVQYLHNIGVGATLTISLMHEDKLWGLIACHHYSTKYLNSFARISAQLQGHFLTSQINVREVEEQHKLSSQINDSLKKMLAKTYSPDRESFKTITEQNELLELCNANGVAIFLDDKLYTNGLVPSNQAIWGIINHLKTYSNQEVFYSSKFADTYPEAAELKNTASGILFHSLDAILNMGIIWFRPETIQEVKWAGDPSKAIIKDEKGLSPRNSFKLWKEFIQFQSNDWNEIELTAASNFARSLEKQAHLLFLSEEENKYRLLSEKLKATNAELENMNWISTHDLKEPLRKIQVFASRILDIGVEDLPITIAESIHRISASANRMQTLISDLLSYSKLQKSNEALTKINLTELVNEVKLRHEAEDLEDRKTVITIRELPNVQGVSFILQQLFSNLISNSIKFAKKDAKAEISIRFAGVVNNPVPLAVGNFNEIVVKDNGIGFAEQHNESIFNVFTRLHLQSEYTGTGIGLALCRKIMQNHNGYITASGKVNEGAEFRLYFPVLTD